MEISIVDKTIITPDVNKILVATVASIPESNIVEEDYKNWCKIHWNIDSCTINKAEISTEIVNTNTPDILYNVKILLKKSKKPQIIRDHKYYYYTINNITITYLDPNDHSIQLNSFEIEHHPIHDLLVINILNIIDQSYLNLNEEKKKDETSITEKFDEDIDWLDAYEWNLIQEALEERKNNNIQQPQTKTDMFRDNLFFFTLRCIDILIEITKNGTYQLTNEFRLFHHDNLPLDTISYDTINNVIVFQDIYGNKYIDTPRNEYDCKGIITNSELVALCAVIFDDINL